MYTVAHNREVMGWDGIEPDKEGRLLTPLATLLLSYSLLLFTSTFVKREDY